jgi:preprotein translocase subunit YajC
VEALAQLLPFVVIAALFWLLLIRPAQRRQRQALATQRAAEPGSEVMLTSGIFGTVVSAADDTLQVEIAPGTSVKVTRAAVARVLTQEPTAEEIVNDEAPGASDGQ